MEKPKKWRWGALLILGSLCAVPMAKMDVEAAVRLNHSSITIKQGKTKKLKLKGTSAKVKWSSDDEEIVSVNKKGKITTLKGGNAVVTAKAGKKKYRCKVYVVGLDTSVLTLNKGDTYKLKVRNGKNTKWTSKKEDIATVNARGKVKARDYGVSTIVCKTNRRKVKCKVYVPTLSDTSLRLEAGSQYQMQIYHTAEECEWYSDNPQAVSVDENGLLTASAEGGSAVISCETGDALLECEVEVFVPQTAVAPMILPTDIVTPMSQLPQESVEDILDVTVQGDSGARTYRVYRQAAEVNKTKGDNGVPSSYMPSHGCAACAASTVLSGYAGMNWGPAYFVETIERNEFGAEWTINYSKKKSKQMPVSLYGITRILDRYGVRNEYVRACDPVGAYQQIENHLKGGNAVIVEVKKMGGDTRWAKTKHTMVLLGMTDTGQVIVADSADRTSTFGNQRRIKYATLLDVFRYTFPCTDLTSTAAYYTREASCGGYILVNPQ